MTSRHVGFIGAAGSEPPSSSVETARKRGPVTIDHITTLWKMQPESFLQRGALICVWMGGFFVLVLLLEEFSAALKPLVLATLFVWILEPVVQFFEWGVARIIRAIKFVCLAVFTGTLGLAVLAISNLCWCKVGGKNSILDFVKRKKETEYERLTQEWQGKHAGQETFARTVAVFITLCIVSVVVYVGAVALTKSVGTVVEELNEYKEQLAIYIQQFHMFVNNTDMLPPEIKGKIQDAMSGSRTGGLPTVVANMWDQLAALLGGLAASSIDFVVSFCFFILYTFLWLADPLHLASVSKEVFDEELEGADDAADQSVGSGRLAEPLLQQPEGGSMNDSFLPQPDAGSFVRKSTALAKFREVAQNKACRKSTRLAKFREIAEIAQTSKRISGKTGLMNDLKDQERNRGDMKKEVETIVEKELQEHIYEIIKTYFLLKTVSNTIFAICVYALLACLKVNLAEIIAIMCGFLSFIPEIGAFISMILPVPLIILQPGFTGDERVQLLAKVLCGMLLIKLFVSNLLETKVMSKSSTLAGVIEMQGTEKKDVTETHPVIILFVVVICGKIWGQIGMLISVPLVSLVRLTKSVWDETHPVVE